ncbi:hypothetical protein K7432_003063 [Basidiobolus ranarum]|uniref:C2H2-type domain-containing protein n=1 Tax=Basidiobolus ranarum TaxID=34480 RepID=A0ABR2X0L3_9FUNG
MYSDCLQFTTYPPHIPYDTKPDSFNYELWLKLSSTSDDKSSTSSNPKMTPLFLFPSSSQASDLISSSQAIPDSSVSSSHAHLPPSKGIVNPLDWPDLDLINLQVFLNYLIDDSGKASSNDSADDQGVLPLGPRHLISTDMGHSLESITNIESNTLHNTSRDASLLASSHILSSNDITLACDNKTIPSLRCPYGECKKLFTTVHSLRTHLRIHDPERPYHCDECDKYFDKIHDLQRHMLTHLTAKGFPCSTCGRGFSRSDAVKRHTRKCIGKPDKRQTDGAKTKPC